MLVIVFASTTSASICRNHSVSILKEPKSYSFIALKTIFINFRETRLARVSKRFVSTNFPSDIALTNRVRGPYFEIRTEFFSARVYGMETVCLDAKISNMCGASIGSGGKGMSRACEISVGCWRLF